MALKVVNTESLDAVANAINAKSGTSGAIQFPEGFVDAIQSMSGGGEDLSTVLAEQEELVAELKSLIAQKAKLGDAKLPSILDRTVTELTAEDLAGATQIGKYAFAYCAALKKITIPASVTKFKTDAFLGAQNIEEVHSASLEEWMSKSFESNSNPLRGAKGLYLNDKLCTEVTIPSNAKIKSYVFQGYDALTKVTINCALTGYYAFTYCEGLTSVILAEGVTEIEANSFQYCSALPSISFPKSLTMIRNYTFSGCNSLKLVDLTAYGQDTAFPTLAGNSALSVIKSNNGEIRVPSGRKAELAAMTNWSTYADNIVEVS